MPRLLAALVLAVACGCGPQPSPHSRPAADAYPGELLDSSALPDGLFVRQRIAAKYGKRDLSFSAVLQTDQGTLSLLALTPYGSRAFSVEQRGQRVSFQRFVDQELPFPPRFILLDVHRTLFIGLPGAPLADGVHEGERSGERIVERWQNARLLERTFTRLDGRPKGAVRIAYQGGMSAGEIPARIDLDNGWFGYRLAIHTLRDG
jgi:hypothetical protein